MDPLAPFSEKTRSWFERAFAGVTLAAPSIPIHSTRTGALVTAVQSRSPEFWAASDALHEAYARWSPLESGLFDYSRLENR